MGQAEILELLKKYTSGLTTSEIANKLNIKNKRTINMSLQKLRKWGDINFITISKKHGIENKYFINKTSDDIKWIKEEEL